MSLFNFSTEHPFDRNTRLTYIILFNINLFVSSSSVDLAVVACFSTSVIYISDARVSGVCSSIFVFMNFKDVTSLSNSICLILLSPSFTFQSFYFPVALPDLKLIFANFQSLLYFSWKWTVAFLFNTCFPVCLFSLELLLLFLLLLSLYL